MQLADLKSRWLLTILLLISTGPLLLRLVSITVSDIIVLLLALLHLMANIFPCLSLLLVLRDAILGKQTSIFGESQTESTTGSQSSQRNREIGPYLRALVGVFIALYACDLFVYVIFSNKLHENYRSASFNLQIFLSTLYLIKPWRWGQVDLRQVAAKFERFYRLALKVTQAIIDLLNNLPRGPPPTLDDATQQDLAPSGFTGPVD